MGFADCGGRRIFGTWRICSAGQKGLDWVVCPIRHLRYRHSNAAAFSFRSYRYRLGDFNFDQTGSPCDFVDGWANWGAPLALLLLIGWPKSVREWIFDNEEITV